MDWHPFSTAPKDGTEIVCFEAGGRMISGTDENNWEPQFVDAYDVRWWEDGDWRGYYSAFTGLDNPSHWARLYPPRDSTPHS